MNASLETLLTEGTWPPLDWCSTSWDTEKLNAIDLNEFTTNMSSDSLNNYFDLTQFSDNFAGSNILEVDINMPHFPQQLEVGSAQ